MINKINISNDDVKNLIETFEKDDKQEVDVRLNNMYISSKVYIESFEEESKLYFYMYEDEVVIQVIFVANGRRGIGTKLIKQCAELGKSKGVKKIRIQSVLTEEMANLCKKLSFKQDQRTKYVDYLGDYISFIDDVLAA